VVLTFWNRSRSRWTRFRRVFRSKSSRWLEL